MLNPAAKDAIIIPVTPGCKPSLGVEMLVGLLHRMRGDVASHPGQEAQEHFLLAGKSGGERW